MFSCLPAIQATGPGLLPRWDLLPLIMPAFAGRTLLVDSSHRVTKVLALRDALMVMRLYLAPTGNTVAKTVERLSEITGRGEKMTGKDLLERLTGVQTSHATPASAVRRQSRKQFPTSIEAVTPEGSAEVSAPSRLSHQAMSVPDVAHGQGGGRPKGYR